MGIGSSVNHQSKDAVILTPPWTADATFWTWDNGGRAFQVQLTRGGRDVHVSRLIYNEDAADGTGTPYSPSAKNELVLRRPLRVFVGGSPRHLGNSVLIEMSGKQAHHEYVCVGENVRAFRTRHRITRFISEIGNSGVPYPFAHAADGSVHLFLEDVTLLGPSALATQGHPDPYNYYYDAVGLITPDMAVPYRVPRIDKFEGITRFYIGSKQYTMTYMPDAAAHYDWMTKNNTKKGAVFIVAHGRRQQLTKKKYVELMERFAKESGLAPLRMRMLRQRA